jgi:septal ring factor EnvC (AmiA/AmiB activator)
MATKKDPPAAAGEQVEAAIADFKDTIAAADAQLSELRKLRHNLSATIEEGETTLSALASNAPRPANRAQVGRG